MGKQPGPKKPALHLSAGQQDSKGDYAKMVRVLVACKPNISRSVSHKQNKTQSTWEMQDIIFKMLTKRFITKPPKLESCAVRLGAVKQAVQKHLCLHSGARNRCVLWITGWWRNEARNGQREKGGMGERWKTLYPTQQIQSKARTDELVAMEDPNATALSIYRGVTYTKTTDEVGNQTQHPTPIQKVLTTGDAETRGGVIVCFLSVHMFTVKELKNKFIISLLGGNAYRCSILDVNRSH